MTKEEVDGELVTQSSSSGSQAGTPMEAKPPLASGDRVRTNAWGRARHPRYGDRQGLVIEGLVVGRGSPSSWRFKFDGRRSIQAIHRDYLEKVGRTDVKEIF
jgi:hypothetical protein